MTKLKISEKWQRIITVAYALFLFAFNYIKIFDNNFWGDECFSIRLARMSIPAMIDATAKDVHPPLYYLILMGVVRVFGEHGWLFHLVSIVPYIILLIFAITVVYKEFGFESSLIMISFSSILRTAVQFNLEVRMYSLAGMCCCFAFFALYRIINGDKTKDYVLFVLFSLGAAYSHYYALISVAFLYVMLIFFAFCKRAGIKKTIVACVVTVISYLPWLLILLDTVKRTSDSFWIESIPGMGECVGYLFHGGTAIYCAIVPLLVFVAVAWILLCEFKNKELLKSGLGLWLFSGWLAALGTIFVGDLFSILVRPVFQSRYLFPVSVIMWLVGAVAVPKLPKGKVIAYMLIVATLLSGFYRYYQEYPVEHNQAASCDESTAFLAENVLTDDVVLTDIGHFEWTILGYYLPDNSYAMLDTGSVLDAGVRYWLFLGSEIDEDKAAWVRSCGREVSELVYSGVMGSNQMYVYEIK